MELLNNKKKLQLANSEECEKLLSSDKFLKNIKLEFDGQIEKIEKL